MDLLRDATDGKLGGNSVLKQLNDLQVPQVTKDSLAKSICQLLGFHSQAASETSEPANRRNKELKDALRVVQSAACISPRGRFDLMLSPTDVVHLHNLKNELRIPVSDIEAVVVLDNLPKDKKGRILITIHLKRDKSATFNKQKLSDIVFQVTSSDQLDIVHPKTHVSMKGPAIVVICQLLGTAGVSPAGFLAPSEAVFKSASGQSGIDAIVKVNQGWLFPLPGHLLFLERPQIFIALTEVKAVDFARASGMSQTFDIRLHLRDAGTQEFSHIPQQEAPLLQQYMAKQGVSLVGDDRTPASSRTEPAAAAASDSESDEDSDFDPEKSSESQDDEPTNADGVIQSNEVNPDDSHAAEASSSDDDEDDSEEDIALVSEDDMPASKVRELMNRENEQRRQKRQRI